MRSWVIGFREFRRNLTRTPLLSVGFILVMMLSLLQLGAAGILSLWIWRLAEEAGRYLEIRAYLTAAVGPEEVERLRARIGEMDGVREVVYVSPEEALQWMQKRYGVPIEEIFGGNPLPATLRVRVAPGAAVERLAEEIASWPEVEETDYPRRRELLRRVEAIRYVAVLLLAALLVLIGGGMVFFVGVVTLLSTYARRKIIRTMRLIGASFPQIRLPFLLEGTLGALAAGVLATAGTIFLYGALWRVRNLYVPFLPLPDFREVVLWLGALLPAIGCVLGAWGAGLAVGRYLTEQAEFG